MPHIDRELSHAVDPQLFVDLNEYPPEFRQHIQKLVRSSADPSRVQHHLAELQHRHPGFLERLEQHPQRLQWLITIFGFSHFLSEQLTRRPEEIFTVSDLHRPLSPWDYKDRLARFLTSRNVSIASAHDLAYFRRLEMIRLVLRDAQSIATLAELTEELSNLADAILSCALDTVTHELEQRYGTPAAYATENGDDPSGFAVLALGKLGGRELNYSSDVDLMFVYAGNGDTSGPDRISNKEFYKKVANRFTSLLSTYTAAGLCYRVDLRLRPEGSLGDVCISLSGALDYYANRARDWELQMLIKARVAAGDMAVGRTLLDSVEPSIYSTSLDFSAIETMSATRERIGEKLANRRLRKSALDVKLAPGGIRDIEFLVQCLQRLHGGRELWVRNGGTLLALSRLLDKDLLSETECARLSSAYQFLRQLEHRLQFEDDRQIHTLPTDPVQLDRLARRMPSFPQPQPGINLSTQLLQILNQHLENVQVLYARIVHAQRPLYYSSLTGRGPVPRAESAPVQETETNTVAVSENFLMTLDHTAPVLSGRLRNRGPRRGHRAFERFIERLIEDPAFLSLLNDHDLLAHYTIQVFELSPYFSEQLIRNPELLEEIRLVADHPNHRWAFEGSAAPLNDVGALRRFFRREMLRIQAASICLQEPVFQTLDRTSALAEFVIARAYRIALEQAIDHARKHAKPEKPFVAPANEMMVVALGRLGMREFDLGSDADLVFIIPDSESVRLQFWTHVVEHLIEILTAYTGDGTILSIDTRLRPNGREGLLVQTESAYTEYFANKAEAWEGIAYMKARALAGDVERSTNFLSELQKVDWRRYGQSGRSKQDLRQMRLRLQREQGASDPLKAGLGGYYDADFILMYLRLKGAGLFFKSLNTPERIDIVEKMGHLDHQDATSLLQGTTFYRALDHALRIITGQAQERLPESRASKEMAGELMERWVQEHLPADSLELELASLQTQTRKLFDRIFGY